MLYAYVDGIRRRAEKGLTGLCKCCDDTVKAFCGEYVTHHWKHRPGSSCSFAGKGESEWHLAWKAKFPEAWQEVIFTDEHTGVKHIADVCTPNGVAIEFQNSTILPEELRQRESFYTKLVWVVNADNFDITFESEAERTIRRMYRGKHEFNHMQDYNTKQAIEQIKAKIRKVKRETELKKDVIGSLENNVKHWQKRKDAFEADKTFGSELKKSGRLPSLKELHAATSLDSSVWIFGKDYGKFQAILTDLEHQ
ncbi:hypothetical protein H9Q13_13275 [Pontibacter sp. JH31]|uniref:Competence protein CoiA-like family protein n=1 Tax=Pontibacter aquaedesilientis TaxID=2766980 RepID=A0ABR7XIM1_9BACT|nr:competence protein CoiA family protein [Pontibacter aquaedesilientis]MBD1398140.1 hypothetical protein [Pontibacter aquaedesilientis]